MKAYDDGRDRHLHGPHITPRASAGKHGADSPVKAEMPLTNLSAQTNSPDTTIIAIHCTALCPWWARDTAARQRSRLMSGTELLCFRLWTELGP